MRTRVDAPATTLPQFTSVHRATSPACCAVPYYTPLCHPFTCHYPISCSSATLPWPSHHVLALPLPCCVRARLADPIPTTYTTPTGYIFYHLTYLPEHVRAYVH